MKVKLNFSIPPPFNGKTSIIMRLFLGWEVTSVRHLQKKPRPSFLLLAFVLRCLYRTVLNRSAADSWVAFGSEGCSLIKKLVKLTCAIVLDLFGGQGDPRGGAQWPLEAVGLQQVGQCYTSERIRGQSKIFWGRRLPIQDWVKPDFW